MRKELLFLGLGAIIAVAFAQSKNLGALGSYVDKLKTAETLSAEFTVTEIGSTSASYTVKFAKPNKFSMQTPRQTVIGDGATITTFDKSAKAYYKQPQSAQNLSAMLANDEYKMFQPFFEAGGYDTLKITGTSTKKRKGVEMQVVTTTMGKKSATFYVDPSGMARQIEFSYPDTTARILVDAKTLDLGVNLGDAFAFKAPSDARELSMEEMMADRWYEDLEEAKKVAAETNRMVFLDVYAEWCGPCKAMEREVYPMEQFKAYAKYFVFCKIDSDKQPAVAQAYNVTALPTVKFLKADGSVIHEFVGYGGPAGVFKQMDVAKAKGGF